MDLPLPLIVAQGTPAECGAAYGRAAADLIAANAASYLDRFASQAGIHPDLVLRAGAEFRATTRQFHPRIAETLDAMAEQAGVVVEEAYALNARTELLYGKPASECTSIGVLGERSASGHTLLAQNWDWHPAQRRYTLLLATQDERGVSVLTLAEAGMLAKAGLNGAGLGVCVNMLGCDRDGRPGGVPYHVLLRAVMEAPTVGAAVATACVSPRSASINLLVGQAFPAGTPGELIDVEAVPGDVGFLHPRDGVLTHANHLESTVAVFDTLKNFGGSSFFRGARALRLLGDGPVDEARIQAVLADHGGYPLAICRHDTSEVTVDDDRSESIYAVTMDLDERRLSIAAGPPCQAEKYVDVPLGGLFD